MNGVLSRRPRLVEGTARPASRRTGLLLLATALLVGLAPAAALAQAGGGWEDLGNDLAGTHGSPLLTGDGHLIEDTPLSITLDNVLAQTRAICVVGVTELNAPFKGGVLVPAPVMIFGVPTGGTAGTPSSVTLNSTIPAGTPVGTQFIVQYWIPDPVGPEGLAASNAIKGTVQTLYDVIAEETDDLLEVAGPPGSSKNIYRLQDFTNLIFERKLKCWARKYDLTGISPWNETGGPTRAGTLISPRHIAFAKHYPISTNPGSNGIVFVTRNDVTVIRYVTAVTYPAGDIGIGLLDQDVPLTINFHKVLPQDWATYLPTVGGLPMLHLDQEEKALVRDMNYLSQNCAHRTPSDPLRRTFSETLIGGDSGNPAFLLIGGEALLILTHWTATSGPFYTWWYDEVNAAMTSLGGGYQLTDFDFDTFLQQ